MAWYSLIIDIERDKDIQTHHLIKMIQVLEVEKKEKRGH